MSISPAQNSKKPLNLPLFQGFLPINTARIPLEIIAGIAFAAFAIPEVMGYTKIAGMPLITGIYTILLPMLAFAIFGSSRHLAIGADSATAAIMASGLMAIALPESPQYVSYAGLIALLAATLLFFAGIFQLGFIADFLSHTILIGFFTGVGIQISISQLSELFGIPHGLCGTPMQIISLFKYIYLTNIPTLLFSLSVIVIMILSRKIHGKFPGSLLAIIGAIIVSWALNLSSFGITLLGTVPGGLPHLSFPQVSISDIPKIFNISVDCFIVIIAQSAATSRAYAIQFSDTYNENLDLIGLSLANVAAGISGTFVVNGSPTKTEMVKNAGGCTQFTHLATVFIVLIVLVFLTGSHLVDIKGMSALHKQRPVEFAVALITAMTVIFMGVKYGLEIAIVLSILAHLRHSYKPFDSLLVPKAGGGISTVPLEEQQQAMEGLLIYRFGSDLYFANENRLTEEIVKLIKNIDSLKWFCISASNI